MKSISILVSYEISFIMPDSFSSADTSNLALTQSDYPFADVFTGNMEYGCQLNQNLEPTLTMLNADCSLLSSIKSENDCRINDAIFHESEEKIKSLVKGPVKLWKEEEVTLWALYVTTKYNLPIFDKFVMKFHDINGEMLCNMTLQGFMSIISDENIAMKYYNELQPFITNDSINDNKLEGKVLHVLQNVSLENIAMETNCDESGDIVDSGVESCDESISDNETHFSYDDQKPIIIKTDPSLMRMDDDIYGIGDYIRELLPDVPIKRDINSYDVLKDHETQFRVDSQAISSDDVNVLEKNNPAKRRVGRPPGSKKPAKDKKIGKLWENIKNWLYDPNYNPSIICWDNYNQGIFRFTDSTKAAQLWGKIKGNQDMTFEKMTRAMRYHYKNNVLKSVDKKLLYQFGEKSNGWRRPNPIL